MIRQLWSFTLRCVGAGWLPAGGSVANFTLQRVVRSDDGQSAKIVNHDIQITGIIAEEFTVGQMYQFRIEEVPDVSDPDYVVPVEATQ